MEIKKRLKRFCFRVLIRGENVYSPLEDKVWQIILVILCDSLLPSSLFLWLQS